jgi:hypothetical protein
MGNAMLDSFTRFVGLFCGGLAAGITLCVLLADRVWVGTGQFYTELMQLLIRALTVPAPVLGVLSLIAMSIDTVKLFERGVGAAFWLGIAAVCLSLAAAALTKLGHFPINDRVLKWDPANPPTDWSAVHARWSAFHVARTSSTVASFALLLLGNLLR